MEGVVYLKIQTGRCQENAEILWPTWVNISADALHMVPDFDGSDV